MNKTLQSFYSKQIKILAFDVDGTLFSSEAIILDTYVESIQKFSINSGKKVIVPTKEKILEQVGLPVKQIFQNLLPELSESERDSISDNVLRLLCEKIFEKKGMLYKGVAETIRELHSRDYLLCIASNGRAAYINAILEAYNLKEYFQELIVIDYVSIRSKGDILKGYLSNFQKTGLSALMIGDRKSDLDAALEAESPFAYCEYGHAEPNEINLYSIKLQSISDLLAIF